MNQKLSFVNASEVTFEAEIKSVWYKQKNGYRKINIFFFSTAKRNQLTTSPAE